MLRYTVYLPGDRWLPVKSLLWVELLWVEWLPATAVADAGMHIVFRPAALYPSALGVSQWTIAEA